MSWQDRPYYRQGPSNPFMSRLSGSSMVAWLLGINAGIFLLNNVLLGSSRGDGFSPARWGYFSVEKGIFGLQIWRWITYQFLHAGFGHVLFNMIGLYFFGPLMERWWGSRRFLAFYLLCGVGGAALFSLFTFVPDVIGVTSRSRMVGASGALFGILVGCAVLYPHQQVMLLIPPIPMKMRTMAMVFLGLALLSLMAGAQNAGGEAAHLGGALLGWILIRNPGWLDFANTEISEKIQHRRATHQRDNRAKEEAEIDRILDKVRDKGLASLTNKEKKTLQRATDRQRGVG